MVLSAERCPYGWQVGWYGVRAQFQQMAVDREFEQVLDSWGIFQGFESLSSDDLDCAAWSSPVAAY